jgi:hypothetical protein
MVHLALEIEEREYSTFVSFLHTLKYVNVLDKSTVTTKSNQVAEIKAVLDNLSIPLFSTIGDPAEWERELRNEWE